MGDEGALAAAREALERHDDRAAIEFLVAVLKTPNPSVRAQALARIEELLQRLRGPSGLREFLESVGEEGVLDKRYAAQVASLVEAVALFADYGRGRPLGDRVFRSLKQLQVTLLGCIQRSAEPEEKWPILQAYSRVLRFAHCTCKLDSLRRFCEEHSLQVWPDNKDMRCLMPVAHVQEVLDKIEWDHIPRFLSGAAQGIRASLLIYPDDEDAVGFVRYLAARLRTSWADRLRGNVRLLAASHHALGMFVGLSEVDDRDVRAALEQMATALARCGAYSTADLGGIGDSSGVSGSASFLREFTRGRLLFESGDYPQSGHVFDDLLRRRQVSPAVRKKILESRIASELGRIRVSTAFGLTSDEFAEEAERRLAELREMDKLSWSSASAKLHLDYFVLVDVPDGCSSEEIKHARELLKSVVRASTDPAAPVDSDYAATLVNSGFRLGMPVDQVVEELVATSALEAFTDFHEIVRGRRVSEPSLPEPPASAESEGGEALEDTVRDDRKWLNEIFTIQSPEKIRKVIEAEIRPPDEQTTVLSPAPHERIRLGVGRIAFRLAQRLLFEDKKEAASCMLEYVIQLTPGQRLPDETELLLHAESAMIHAERCEQDALKRCEALLNRIIEHAGDRAIGELSFGLRRLHGAVTRHLNLLKATFLGPGDKGHGK